jgi:hypothetical protein
MPSSSNKAKTRKMNRGGTPTGECEKTYCKKFVNYAMEFSNMFLKNIENMPNKTDNQKKLIKTMKSKKYKTILTTKAKKECKSKYCNVGCKDTIFEDGKELPKKMMTEFKDNPALIDLLLKAKKELFGTQTTILKDNFYNKLKPSTITVLKKEGAISGCVRVPPKL